MKLVLIFFAIVAVTQARVVVSPIHGRIVNGEDAHPGDFPYQVSLQFSHIPFHFCGGSIMNEKYVITAAHCVEAKSSDDILIIAGTTHWDRPELTHEVEKIIVHAEYNPSDTWRNDIALIKVKREFVPSSLLKFVTLPLSNQEIPTKSVAVVSGWGSLWEGGHGPYNLKFTKISIASQDYCEKVYKEYNFQISSSQVCAYDPINAHGACHGDSGGPLTVDGILVGVVSWGAGCASTVYPTVYTRVPEYINWIKAHAV